MKPFQMVLILMTGLLFFSPELFAKKDQGPSGENAPRGWIEGEKKGWDGGSIPPGLAKKEEGAGEHLKGAKKEKKAKKAKREKDGKKNSE